MYRIRIAVLLLITASLAGCYLDKEQDLYPSSFCDLTSVTWSGTIQPLVQSTCAIPGCHVPGETSPDLTVFANVDTVAQSGLLRDVTLIDRSMPMNGSLTTCQMQQIDLWLKDGAPEN